MQKEKRFETILTICFGLLIFHFIFKIKILLTLAVVIASAGLFSSFLSKGINWFWTKLTHLLGSINGNILLSIIFFLILSPLGLLMRTTHKLSLRLKKGQATSFYDERNHKYVPDDLENTW